MFIFGCAGIIYVFCLLYLVSLVCFACLMIRATHYVRNQHGLMSQYVSLQPCSCAYANCCMHSCVCVFQAVREFMNQSLNLKMVFYFMLGEMAILYGGCACKRGMLGDSFVSWELTEVQEHIISKFTLWVPPGALLLCTQQCHIFLPIIMIARNPKRKLIITFLSTQNNIHPLFESVSLRAEWRLLYCSCGHYLSITAQTNAHSVGLLMISAGCLQKSLPQNVFPHKLIRPNNTFRKSFHFKGMKSPCTVVDADLFLFCALFLVKN